MSSSTTTPLNPLIAFYDPSILAPDAQNRTLNTILSWPDSKLEYQHDYIQTLFPLPEPSPINPSAPTIDRTTFHAFRSRPELRSNLRRSLNRMLQFYGFEFAPDGTIGPAPNFNSRAKNWVTRFNHNHLRITRILRSCRVLGLEREAGEFLEALVGVYEGWKGRDGIGERSVGFWRRAGERPLYLAPEKDGDDGKGAGFLYEFERERMRERMG